MGIILDLVETFQTVSVGNWVNRGYWAAPCRAGAKRWRRAVWFAGWFSPLEAPAPYIPPQGSIEPIAKLHDLSFAYLPERVGGS